MMLTIQWWMWWKIIITRTSSNTNEWIVRKNRYGRRRCPNIFYICVHDVMWCDVNGITDEFLYSINNHLLLHDIGFLFRMIFFGNFNFVFIIWWKRNFFFSFGTFKKNMNEWQTCPWKKNPHISFVVDQRKKKRKVNIQNKKWWQTDPLVFGPGTYINTYILRYISMCVCVGVCLFVCVLFVLDWLCNLFSLFII